MSGRRPLARSPWFGDARTSATTEESAANGKGDFAPEIPLGVERGFEPDERELELDLEPDMEPDMR